LHRGVFRVLEDVRHALHNRVRAILPNGRRIKRIVRRLNLERAARGNAARYNNVRPLRLRLRFKRRFKVDSKPLISFVKVSVRTAELPALSVAVMVIVCARLKGR
jgi:hypothetical protein